MILLKLAYCGLISLNFIYACLHKSNLCKPTASQCEGSFSTWQEFNKCLQLSGRAPNALLQSHLVKCGKIMEVTPGTPDVKSGPMRCQKGLRFQLMCCAPFRLLSQDFGTKKTEYRRSEYWSIGVWIRVVLRIELGG